jgi:hypothetical protein
LYSITLATSHFSHALDAHAGLVPGTLNPSDTFYVVFVGSTTITGNLATFAYEQYAVDTAATGTQTGGVTAWIIP